MSVDERSRSGPGTAKRPPRLRYFIQNHLGPEQAGRLVRRLRRSDPEGFILVGHDEFAGHASAAEVERALGVPVIAARQPAKRGYLSLIEPYFDAVEWLAGRGIDHDWIAYLSAQDYPVKPLASLKALLAEGGHDGYIRHWDAAAERNPWGRRRQGILRYHYQYADAPSWVAPVLPALRWLNGIQSAMHLHLVYGPRVGFRRRETPFDRVGPCQAGYQWHVLSRACAEHVVERVRADRELMDWFARTICPCEAVVQTILVNSGRFRLCDDDLHHADFTGSRTGRPRILTQADLPAITSGTHHFARKFDPRQDARVLDLLDDLLDGRSG